jgi:hypothetical protein
VTVYYTGAGTLPAPGIADGQPAPATGGVSPLSLLTLTLSGTGVPPMTFSNDPINTGNPNNYVVTTAMMPGAVGVTQTCFTVPATLTPGPYNLSISLRGFATAAGTALPSTSGNTIPIWVGAGGSASTTSACPTI